MDPLPAPSGPTEPHPSPFRYLLSYLLVSLAWGLTTPFIRRAAVLHKPGAHPILTSPTLSRPVRLVLGLAFKVVDLLRDWRYAVPLLLNMTGSVWFFVLVGKSG
ncbi:MAG: hypothetical protein M1825_003988 [Sarcosagium campestre]|nr:MAG: hypothetical protein M1825_003988 [Sarcosagium campestre]